MVTWNGDRNKILLVVWHNDPERFEEGRTIKLGDEVLWTVADKEFRKWFNQNKNSVRNWTRRLHQLMGYSLDTTLNYFSTIWVDPKDVVRPAFEIDPTGNTMRASFIDDTPPSEPAMIGDDMPSTESTEPAAESPFGKKDEAFMIWYQNWFDETAAKYEKKSSKRLWTRLGLHLRLVPECAHLRPLRIHRCPRRPGARELHEADQGLLELAEFRNVIRPIGLQ
jgi:hypothetical protein